MHVEFGECVPQGKEANYTCDSLRDFVSDFGEMQDCDSSICEGNQCNTFHLEDTSHCNRRFRDDGKLSCWMHISVNDIILGDFSLQQKYKK